MKYFKDESPCQIDTSCLEQQFHEQRMALVNDFITIIVLLLLFSN